MQPVEPQPPATELVEPPRLAWYQWLGSLLFIVVCFEVGVFLLVFPWLDYWNNNLIASLAPWVRDVWMSPFFRGALSGLGIVNMYISLAEIIRVRRPAADRLKESLL